LDASVRAVLQILVGLLTTNGPGSITAQGAKGAMSSNGPQMLSPGWINKVVGCLGHGGSSHGGNGLIGSAW
jgi:hypothetical protein